MKTLFIVLTLAMPLFSRASPEQKFWKWFSANSPRLLKVSASDDPMLQELSKRLEDIHEDLTYEMSTKAVEPKELIISGEGIKDLIPTVESLVESAPELDGWKFIAFRPRMKDYSNLSLRYGDREYTPSDISFAPITREGHFDMIVYFEGFTEENKNEFIGPAYIMLDMALGEYDVMTNVRYMDFQALPPEDDRDGILPFTSLRKVFDDFHENRTESGRNGD